jgi:hypothetical protein
MHVTMNTSNTPDPTHAVATNTTNASTAAALVHVHDASQSSSSSSESTPSEDFNLVTTFIRRLVAEHGDDIYESWGMWYPKRPAGGAVDGLLYLFDRILSAPVAITIAEEQYIELFANEWSLRVEYRCLSAELRDKYIKPMLHPRRWLNFFKRRTVGVADVNMRVCLTEFRFNSIVDRVLSRETIIKTMTMKALLVSVCAPDEGVAFNAITTVLAATFRNLTLRHPTRLFLYDICTMLDRPDLHLRCFCIAASLRH